MKGDQSVRGRSFRQIVRSYLRCGRPELAGTLQQFLETDAGGQARNLRLGLEKMDFRLRAIRDVNKRRVHLPPTDQSSGCKTKEPKAILEACLRRMSTHPSLCLDNLSP